MADYILRLDCYLTSLKDDPSAITAITILFIFNLLLSFTIPDKKNILNSSGNDFFLNNNPSNNLLVGVILIVLILIFFYGFTKPDTIGERGKPSTIYEYSIILFIVAFYYSQARANRVFLVVLILSYIVQNMSYGGRATAIQLIICLFLIFFEKKISPIQAMPFLIAAIIIFTAVGNYRTSLTLNSSLIKNIIKTLSNSGFINDTAYSSYFTSQTFILVSHKVTLTERFDLFLRFILSMFLGGTKVPNSNLSNYTHQYYIHYYGGVLPYFGFFYFGIIGVVLIVLLIRYYNQYIINQKYSENGLKKCLSVYIVSTVPRWYLYSPSPLLRGVLLTIIVYYIARQANIFLTRRSIGWL
jgi:hypothetical protein